MSSPSAAARRPARTQPGPARTQPGPAPTSPSELRSEHDRIERLFGALDDIGRYLPGPDTAGQVGQAWARISDLLLAHADAEEQLGALGPPGQNAAGLRAAGLAASLNRMRGAVALAAGHRAGSADWWRAVHAARLAAGRHIRLARRGKTGPQ
jgi:hypothetical protein